MSALQAQRKRTVCSSTFWGLIALLFSVQSSVAFASTGDGVSQNVTWLFAAVLILMVLCLAFEETLHAKKSLITGLFAVLSLLLATYFDLLPSGTVSNAFGESIALPVYIPAVDWEVIAIIVGASLFWHIWRTTVRICRHHNQPRISR